MTPPNCSVEGTPFVAGRRLAAFTDSDERAVGLDQAVPFLLESRLRHLSALHEGPAIGSPMWCGIDDW